MCAARCYRSLKRDEEITLWRSLCALGAPLYGNLCISFSPFLLLFSFSFSPSLASRCVFFLFFSSFLVSSLSIQYPGSFFAVLPLSLCVHLSRCALSSASASSSISLARSMKHTAFLLFRLSLLLGLSPQLLALLLLLFFSPSLLVPFFLFLSYSSLFDCSRTSTFAPLSSFSLFFVASG